MTRDECIEHLWGELEDKTMIEGDHGLLYLYSDWFIFKAGTAQYDIWSWFGSNHSKGIYWLALHAIEGPKC